MWKIKKILFFTILIISLFSIAYGDTNLSGSVTTDKILVIENRYIITSDVTINSYATLTIGPGVEIKIHDYQSITVNGTN